MAPAKPRHCLELGAEVSQNHATDSPVPPISALNYLLWKTRYRDYVINCKTDVTLNISRNTHNANQVHVTKWLTFA